MKISHISQTARRLAVAGGIALAAGAPAWAGNAGGAAFDAGKAVALPGWQLDFQAMNPAIKMAAAYGDRNTGAHGTFGTFPPRFVTPSHTHTAAYHGVVIKGVMSNPFAGEESSPTMEPGSYWYVPAGIVHTTTCVSDVPCEFYFYSDAAFDFLPVK